MSTSGKGKNYVDEIRTWLEKQYAYTLHRQVRKRFARNPYTVTNAMGVWECILLDVQAYAKYNDNNRHLLLVLDVFSNYLYLMLVKTKRRPSVASGIRYIFDEPKYSKRRPIWVRTDKGKEDLNKHFQEHVTGRGWHSVSGVSKSRFQMCGRGTYAPHDSR